MDTRVRICISVTRECQWNCSDEITHNLARKCWNMKKPKTMKLGEKVALSAVKKKRQSRDDINSESRSRVCKKIREKKSSNRPLWQSQCVLGFYLTYFCRSCARACSLSLSRAHIVNFITRKKFPPSIPGYRRWLLFAKSILTATPAYSSGNRIRSTMGSTRSLYFR